MKKILWALISAVLLAVSFPTVIEGLHFIDLSSLAWIALIPLFLICRSSSLKEVARLVVLTSFVFNALVSYWLFYAFPQYPHFSFVGIIVIGLILAAMNSLAVIAALWTVRRWHFSELLMIPLSWIVYEWLRNFIPLGGYPWAQLAYTQRGASILTQSADVFGIYGLGFLIVFVNLLGVDLVEWLSRKQAFPKKGLIAALLLIIVTLSYGLIRLPMIKKDVDAAPTFKVALVQPNISQDSKWEPEQASISLEILGELTDQAIDQGAKLIIWPEASYTRLIPAQSKLLKFMDRWETPILVGALTAKFTTFQVYGQPILYNSALEVVSKGVVKGIYHKTHLIPMGEYFPMRDLLVLVEPNVGLLRYMYPGKSFTPFETDYPYGITICFEDLFPEISRKFTLNGAQFLTNLTNDARFDLSSEPWQHLRLSQFRAIENRRSMVRSTNTGITAAVLPTGEVVSALAIQQEGVLLVDVPLMRSQTIYTRYGDLMWQILLALGLVAQIIFLRKTSSRRSCK